MRDLDLPAASQHFSESVAVKAIDVHVDNAQGGGREQQHDDHDARPRRDVEPERLGGPAVELEAGGARSARAPQVLRDSEAPGARRQLLPREEGSESLEARVLPVLCVRVDGKDAAADRAEDVGGEEHDDKERWNCGFAGCRFCSASVFLRLANDRSIKRSIK